MRIALYSNTLFQTGYGLQVWDYYYNFKQYKCYPDTPANIEIQEIQDKNHSNIDFTTDTFKVLHLSWEEDLSIVDKHAPLFDLIIIDNSLEQMCVLTDDMVAAIKNDNVYLLTASFISPEYALKDKILSLSIDWIYNMRYFSDPLMFTRYFINTVLPREGIVYIGGQLRSWRKYLLDTLPANINIIQTATEVVTTNDVLMDTSAQRFIDYCNERYDVTGDNIVSDIGNPFYASIHMGFNDRRTGTVNIGLITLDEYKTSQCVIYPEASLINYEIKPTEKTWKCIVCKTHWIMFAGCHSYRLLKEYGIESILSLVPNGLAFDDIEDHKQRYDAQMKIIQYLADNQDIFHTSEALAILNSNYESFFSNAYLIEQLVNKLDKILEKHI